MSDSTLVPKAASLTGRWAGWFTLAAIAVLMGLLCLRVWQIGVTHTDDAMWVLRSYTSYFGTVDDWARWQGRIWAYASGSLIMAALALQGTVAGELLRLGSFVLFFLAFHLVAAVYAGRRAALLAASLFLALFALKWDGSLLTTYPMLTWPAATAMCGALLAGRAWCAPDGRRWQLWAAGVLLFAALFNNEGVTVTFIALALLAPLANPAAPAPGWRAPRVRTLLLLTVGVAALYAAIYIGWRLAHPTVYPGNTVAPFHLQRILVTWFHFSTSGSVLHELLHPLSLSIADAGGQGVRHDYSLWQYASRVGRAPLALLAGMLSGALVWRLLAGAKREQAGAPLRHGLRAGLVLALLPILPVALVGTYQMWAVDMQVRAYSHTIFAHFGWSLVLAVLLLRLAGRVRQAWLPLLLAAACAVLATLAYRANDDIAAGMRPEAGRWHVVDRAIAANRALLKAGTMWAPGLLQRTQYGTLYAGYWEDYVAARYHENTEMAVRIPDINELLHGLAMLDYAWDARARRMPMLMMAYRKQERDGAYLAGRIVVDLDGAAPARYSLAYSEGTVARRISVAKLDAAAGLAWFDPPAGIDPASVRLLDRGGNTLCAIRVPQGLRIDFKRPRVATPAYDAASFLDGGWYRLEANAVWSRGGAAHIRIPRHLLPAGPLQVELDAASYTSLGYGPGLQTLRASIDGVAQGQWDYRPGATPAVRLAVPPGTAWLDIGFDISPTMNPKRLGLDPKDDRELGLLLKAVTFLPAVP